MKTVTIEELLSWAFVQELPKGGGVEGLANAHSAWGTICELGTRVQTSGMGNGENFMIEQGEPSPDALAVGRAVKSLAGFEVKIPEGWNPLADWPALPPQSAGLIPDAVDRALAHYRSRDRRTRSEGIVTLVVSTAVLRRELDVTAEPLAVRMVTMNGKPGWFMMREFVDAETGERAVREVDGFNPKSQRPRPGAYRKFEFSDDPIAGILGRLDYQIWVEALHHVARVVTPELQAHWLKPFERSRTPWLAGDHGSVMLVRPGDLSGASRRTPRAA